MSHATTGIIQERRAALNEHQETKTALCERLDQIVGGNTLAAIVDGTLPGKLAVNDFEEEDWGQIWLSGFVEDKVFLSGDRSAVLDELYSTLYGILLCFEFFGMDLDNAWAVNMHFFAFSEELEVLPLTEFAQYVSNQAKTQGMSDEATLALVSFLCDGDLGTAH